MNTEFSWEVKSGIAYCISEYYASRDIEVNGVEVTHVNIVNIHDYNEHDCNEYKVHYTYENKKGQFKQNELLVSFFITDSDNIECIVFESDPIL